jgi:hypothetical protein
VSKPTCGARHAGPSFKSYWQLVESGIVHTPFWHEAGGMHLAPVAEQAAPSAANAWHTLSTHWPEALQTAKPVTAKPVSMAPQA